MSVPIAGPKTALLLDAAGTLLHPAEPIAQTYARIANEHGVAVTPAYVGERFVGVMKRAAPLRRDVADQPEEREASPHGGRTPSKGGFHGRQDNWRPFWRVVVHECTGSDDAELLDALIHHFRVPAAWRVAAGAASCCEQVRARGMKVAVVSNWDHHLRSLLEQLGITAWVDAIVISSEEQLEKPDPRMFFRACERLGVEPHAAVHVGNDPHEDIVGATSAGCAALLIGRDIEDFDALARRLLDT